MTANKTRQLDFSFAVGSPDGPRSGVWRVTDYRSDVYVAPREMMFAAKVSLHRDRTCLFKVNREHWGRMAGWGIEFSGPKAFAKWMRPDPTASAITTALLLTFPMEGLEPSQFGKDPAKVIWLDPPKKGEAVKVGFVYIQGVGRDMDVQISPPARTLGYSHLENGETIAVVAHTMPIDLNPMFGWYRTPRSAQPKYMTRNTAIKQSGLLRGVFHAAPPEEGTFELVEMVIRDKPPRED